MDFYQVGKVPVNSIVRRAALVCARVEPAVGCRVVQDGCVLVLFDIDGTLVLTGGAGVLALEIACREVLGVERPCEGLDTGGKTDPAIVREIALRHLGRPATPDEHDRVIARYLVALAAHMPTAPKYRVLPGVEAALAATEARGCAVGLATGNVAAGARIKLERADLWRRFAFGGYGCDAEDRGALVARGIERGEAHARRTYARAREVLVIGDTIRDVAAARAVGAVAVAVATGSQSVDVLRAAGPDVVLETLEELPSWLDRHAAG